ncbi:hypothetical protein MASR1M48_17170 [Lactococcus petauri]
MSKAPRKCDLCGKFRKLSDLTGVGGEYDEYWFECRFCCSQSEYERAFAKSDRITIKDWAGNVLFEGDFKDEGVDKVLNANRCLLCGDMTDQQKQQECPKCEDTGYTGDFNVAWVDKARTDNVYEFINY